MKGCDLIMAIKPDMVTKVGLDLTDAAKSVKLMTTQVRANQSAWKAMEAQMKSVGDYVGAAKTKYDGLANSVEKQKNKISELKDQQSKLNRNTTEGEKAYQQYDVKINNATKQLANYEAQMKRADGALENQTSGLVSLQHEYKTQSDLSKSLVERYKAEGNESKALKAEYDGQKDRLANLGKQYDIQNDKSKKLSDEVDKSKAAYKRQEDAVKRARNEFGDTSDEYKQAQDKLSKLDNEVKQSESAFAKQKTAVNKTATAMADAKSDTKKLYDEMNKKPHNFLNGVLDKLKQTSDKTEKLNGLFGKVFGANLLANAASSAWNTITNHVGDAIKSGNDYLEQQDKMSASWKTLTGSAKGSKEMVNAVNDLATSAQNSAEMVNGLANQFYAVDKNKDHVMNLSKATLTLQDAFGATDDEIQNFGKQWSQMMANGKVSAQDFMSFTNVFPALKPALLDYEKDVTHNSKLTMAQLNDMISKGKISSETMNKVLEDTAKKNQKATENFGKTIPGMTRTIQSSMPKLLGAIEQPFYKMKNPLVGSISKWVTDKNTTKEFSKLGKAITGALDDITSAFGGKKLDAGKALDQMLGGVTDAVKNLGHWTKTHKQDIRDFFANFKQKSADYIKIIGSTLQTFSGIVTPLIKVMAQHPKIAGTFLAGFMIAGKVAVPISLVAGGIGKLKSAISKGNLAGHISKVSGALNKMGQLAKTNPYVVIIAGIVALVAAFVELYKHNKKFKKFIDGIVKSAKKAWKGVTKWFGKIWKDTKKIFGKITKFFKNNWKDVGLLIANPVVGAFNLLYKHNKKFKKFCDGLVHKAKGMAKGIKNWFGNMKDGAVKHVTNMWNGTKEKFSKGWSAVNDGAKSGSKWITDKFSGMKKSIASHVSNTWNNTKDKFSNGWKKLSNGAKSGASNVSGHFSSLKSSVSKFTGNMWSSVSNNLGKVWGKFKNVFGGLGGIISGAARAVHSGIVTIARNAIRPFNTMLNGIKTGINWVLGKVGASRIKASWSIPLPAYAKGTGGILKDQLALVNDAKSSKYREMFRTPDGKIGMFPKKRNMIVPLRRGTEILDGENSAKLAKAMGLNAYAGGWGNFFGSMNSFDWSSLNFGNIFGGNSFMSSATSSVSGFFGSIWDGAKDIIDDAENIVAHPIKFLKDVFSKYVGNIGSAKGFMSQIVSSLPSLVANKASSWIKKMFADMGSEEPKGTGVKRWRPVVRKALHKNGLSTSPAMIAKVLRQIQTESGGNPRAVQGNIGDINNKTGDLAKGLMQTISATFNAYAFPGHHNIFRGYDNLLAALNYAKHRYGSNLSFLGNGHGYANGGLINQHQMIEVAENNQPEMVIPLSTMKRSRGYELLGQTVTHFASQDGRYNTSDSTNNKVENMLAKFDKIIEQGVAKQGLTNEIIALLIRLLGVVADPNTSQSQREGIRNIEQLIAQFDGQKGRGRLA